MEWCIWQPEDGIQATIGRHFPIQLHGQSVDADRTSLHAAGLRPGFGKPIGADPFGFYRTCDWRIFVSRSV